MNTSRFPQLTKHAIPYSSVTTLNSVQLQELTWCHLPVHCVLYCRQVIIKWACSTWNYSKTCTSYAYLPEVHNLLEVTSLFPILDLHRVATSEQCKLPRAYLPNAIDYDYFMVEWVMLITIPTHIHFNINMYRRTTSPEVSQCVRPWHYFYWNFLPLHQTWNDLVLGGRHAC